MNSSLSALLSRNQQYVVVTASLAYIIYALLTALIDPPPGTFPTAYQVPKFWAILVSLGTLVFTLLYPQWLRWIYLVTIFGYWLVTALEIPRSAAWGTMPLHLTLWLSLNVLVCYLVFGSRWGTVLNALSIALIMVVLVVSGPLAPPQIADWVTVALAMTVTGVLAYITTSFIESNLLLHAQDSEKLRAARLDALTEVYGRGAIEEELARAMNHAQKHNTPLSILVTDLDYFKAVNDKFGHAAGDDVLRAVAKRLRRNVGGIGGMVGRWGGEEFMVLLPGMSKPEALVLAETLRREISNHPVAGLDITASFGVASYRGAGDTADQLFGRADLAMYEAKSGGRNAVR